ncbi:MAG: hypothetical protein ABI970_19065, partial [Chloroflexota bacterium]
MAENHILAVHTYGSQRVKNPRTKNTVSAYKIGYSSAACETLLTLFGAKARDVSSAQASYRYVQIDGDTSVRHGYLLLNVTADDLARAEAVTRRYHRAAVFLWRDSKWLELPNNSSTTYVEPTAHSGPNFDPSGYRPVSPTTGEKEAVIEGIHTEKSQRNPQERPWWWLLGDTYPQREILKRHGARFSSKRRCWYYVGWELPDGIRQLITETAPIERESTSSIEADAPCSDEEAERILGVHLAPQSSHITHDVLSIQESVTPAQDTNGFRRTDDMVAKIVSDSIPVLSEEAPNAIPDAPTEPQHIRVYKPQPFPADGSPLDDVQSAIVQAKTQPIPVLHTVASPQKRTLATIGQSYVGELTGSITGNVYCYGYAIHEGVCVYVNMGGPRMAVEAIRAKFSKGEIVNCVPWDAPAIELTAGEGNSGMYHDFMQNIPEAKFTSLILCHDLLTNPNYGGKSTTFVLRTDEAQAIAKLKQHITELV